MGLDDKFENAKDQAAGKAKSAVGDATDDQDLKAEGEAQDSKGKLKDAGEKVKDAFKK
ncbi:CsbD family protein [Janibacter corallicola]|uniref:CsbD family protein n=1 Tax=Janibacter corallicola TaxID=415212 RepID=UPI00082A7A4F|nr:CsbD family protein [Janibacter corallicola]